MELTKEKREYLEELGFGIEEERELRLNTYEIRYCIEKGYLEKDEKFEGTESSYRVFKDLREHGITTQIDILGISYSSSPAAATTW